MAEESFKQWIISGLKKVVLNNSLLCVFVGSPILAGGIMLPLSGHYIGAVLLIPGIPLYLYSIYLIDHKNGKKNSPV